MTESLLNKKLPDLNLTSRHWITLGSILLLALFLRMAMIDMIEGTVPIRNDALEYYSYAANLKYHDTYSMTWTGDIVDGNAEAISDRNRPPGYSLLIYPFVTWPPTEEMVRQIRIAQVLIDTLTVLLSFFLFRKFMNDGLSLAATFLVAISPHLIAMNIYLLTETVFTFFLILFSLLLSHALAIKNKPLTLISGIILGFTLLIKPTMNYYLVFLLLLLVWHYRGKFDYKMGAAFILGMVLVLSPWVIRNIMVGYPEQAESKSLGSLQNGSYPGLMYNDIPETRAIPHRADPNYNDIQSYGDFFRDLTEKVASDPVKYLQWYALGKPMMMLSWDMVAGAGDIFVYPVDYSPFEDRQFFMLIHAFMQLIHPVLMILALLALVKIVISNRITVNGMDSTHMHKNITLMILCSSLLYFFVLHLAATPLPRYMIPLRPIMFGLAIYSLAETGKWLDSRFNLMNRIRKSP